MFIFHSDNSKNTEMKFPINGTYFSVEFGLSLILIKMQLHLNYQENLISII